MIIMIKDNDKNKWANLPLAVGQSRKRNIIMIITMIMTQNDNKDK